MSRRNKHSEVQQPAPSPPLCPKVPPLLCICLLHVSRSPGITAGHLPTCHSPSRLKAQGPAVTLDPQHPSSYLTQPDCSPSSLEEVHVPPCTTRVRRATRPHPGKTANYVSSRCSLRLLVLPSPNPSFT